MDQCPRCGHRLSEGNPTHEGGLASLQPLLCPSCGASLYPASQNGWKIAGDLIRNYFSDVWMILTRPTTFFRVLPLSGGIRRPLAFALVTHWLGSAVAFLWQLSMGGMMGSYFQKILKFVDEYYTERDFGFSVKERLMQWFSGVGPVIADPFLTLISILFTSFFVFLGARLLVTPGKNGHPAEITYESAVRIIAFGMTPAILAAFPLFGGFFASIGTLIVTVIGAKEAYRVGVGRAAIIALFPKVLFFGIIFLGLLLFLGVALTFMASFF